MSEILPKTTSSKYANLHKSEESQHWGPHVVFTIFIGITTGAQGRARKRGRGVGPILVNQDLPPKRRRLYRLSKIARGRAVLRWRHNKFQRFFTGGQSLQDVAPSLRQRAVQPSELPMIGIVRHEMKWYSRNNWTLWCFEEATAEAVEVCMSSVDTAFLHGLTTKTDGFSVPFFPPLQCKACHRLRQPKRSAQPQM